MKVKIFLNFNTNAGMLSKIVPEMYEEDAQPIGQAAYLLLQNVGTNLDQGARQKPVLEQDNKVHHPFLTGDLVCWSGRISGNASAHYRQALQEIHLGETMPGPGELPYPVNPRQGIVYDPRNMRSFHERANAGSVFERAAGLIALRWHYQPIDGQFRPAGDVDRTLPSQYPSKSASARIRRGFRATKEALESLISCDANVS